MKLTKDDPKLTAYALGELSPRESHEVAKALESQPDLAREVDDIRAFEALFGEQDKLSPKQRAEIFQFGKIAGNAVRIPQQGWRFGVAAALGIAAAVVLTLSLLQSPKIGSGEELAQVDWSAWSDTDLLKRVTANTAPWLSKVDNGSQKSASSSEDLKLHAASYRSAMQSRSTTVRSLSENTPNSAPAWVAQASQPISRVPLVAGNASYQWVSQSIEAGNLPQPSLVREEELLNVQVPQLQADLIVAGVSGSVELVQSPWDAQQLLAFVRVSGDNGAVAQAALDFSEAVKAYRLIGYAAEADSHTAPMAQQMQHSSLVVYELQLTGALDESTEVLALELQIGEGDQQQVDKLRVLYTAPSWDTLYNSELRHSVLVATWAKWLKNPSDSVLKSAVQSQVDAAVQANAGGNAMLQVIAKSLTF